MRARPIRRRIRRSSGLPTLLVGVAVLAHLLIAAHTASHLSARLSHVTTQHCAICALGKHSPGVPTLVVTASAVTAAWVLECLPPRLAPLPEVEAGTLARGPPLPPLATFG